MKRRLFLNRMMRAALLAIGSATAVFSNWMARAQQNQTNTTNQVPATNAPPAGGRRGRRNNGPPRDYGPDEPARLVKLGNRGVTVHDPSTIAKCKDEYWIFFTGAGAPSY